MREPNALRVRGSAGEAHGTSGFIGGTPMTATGTVALPGTYLVCNIGEPATPNEAVALTEEEEYQFQW